MPIFGNNQTDITNSFNVAGNMKELAIQQDNQGKIMSDTINKFNAARDEMSQLQAQTGAILSSYGVDENGKPDASAPKYVHDLFNSVNKEGGVANLSRTQMIAGLQGYDTGTKVEQQRNALDLERLKVKQIKKAMQDQEDIEAAQVEIDRARRAGELNTTKTGTQKKVRAVKIGEETLQLDTQEFSNDFSELDVAESKNDKEAIAKIQDRIARKIYKKTSKSKRELEVSKNGLAEDDENFEGYQTIANPDFQEYVSPYITPDVVSLDTPEDIAQFNKNKEIATREGLKYGEFMSKGLAQFRTDRGNAQNKQAVNSMSDADKEIKSLEARKKALEEGGDNDTGPNAVGAVASASVAGGRGITNTLVNEYAIKSAIRHQKMLGLWKAKDITPDLARQLVKGLNNDLVSQYGLNLTAMFEGITTTLFGDNITSAEQKIIRKAINDVRSENSVNPELLSNATKQRQTKIDDIEERIAKLKSQKSATQSKIIKSKSDEAYTWSGKSLDYVEREKDEYVRREEEVTVELQKTMDEQVTDQYELARNYLMTTKGRIPPSFTKQAYAASQGIVMPVSMDMGNGYSYMKIGGLEKFVENKGADGQNLMSIPDQQRLREAANLGKQKDLNGLTANGFTFSGEINVNDINMANKVRTELLTNTRALQDVDRLINIAENSSALDKMLPAELTGYAQQIQNSIQAAKRTEVGGSGAWSEQDQLRIDKIIADPTSLRNIIFRDQVLGSLKGFKERLTGSLKDQGTAYGFKFTLGSVRDQSMSGFKSAYSAFIARGYSPQQARQAAMPYLNGNTQ